MSPALTAAVSAVVVYLDAWPKRCTCCGETYTQAAWERLPLLGYQDVPEDPLDDRPEAHQVQLRNCDGKRGSGRDCLTTLGVAVAS